MHLQRWNLEKEGSAEKGCYLTSRTCAFCFSINSIIFNRFNQRVSLKDSKFVWKKFTRWFLTFASTFESSRYACKVHSFLFWIINSSYSLCCASFTFYLIFADIPPALSLARISNLTSIYRIIKRNVKSIYIYGRFHTLQSERRFNISTVFFTTGRFSFCMMDERNWIHATVISAIPVVLTAPFKNSCPIEPESKIFPRKRRKRFRSPSFPPSILSFLRISSNPLWTLTRYLAPANFPPRAIATRVKIKLSRALDHFLYLSRSYLIIIIKKGGKKNGTARVNNDAWKVFGGSRHDLNDVRPVNFLIAFHRGCQHNPLEEEGGVKGGGAGARGTFWKRGVSREWKVVDVTGRPRVCVNLSSVRRVDLVRGKDRSRAGFRVTVI